MYNCTLNTFSFIQPSATKIACKHDIPIYISQIVFTFLITENVFVSVSCLDGIAFYFKLYEFFAFNRNPELFVQSEFYMKLINKFYLHETSYSNPIPQ